MEFQKFERQALYEAVWETPISRLAPQYGLTGNGLKKICRKMNIPLPTRGYWARRAVGKAVERMPLPTRAETSVVHRAWRPPPEDFSLSEDDAWRQARLAYDADPANAITVEPKPRRWHQAVAPIRELLRELASKITVSQRAQERFDRLPERRQRDHGVFYDGWDWRGYERNSQLMPVTVRSTAVRLSLESYPRGLSILNAFCCAAQRRGFECVYAEKRGRLVMTGHGGEIELRLTEATEQKTRTVTRYDGKPEEERYRAPTGRLRLYLGWTWGSEREVSDSPEAPLEQRLGDALRIVYRQVIACRERTRRDEENERRASLAAAERAEAERTRREKQAQQEAERQRRETLIAEANAWEQAKLIRRYVEARRRSAAPTADSESWSEWALSVANQVSSLVD